MYASADGPSTTTTYTKAQVGEMLAAAPDALEYFLKLPYVINMGDAIPSTTVNDFIKAWNWKAANPPPSSDNPGNNRGFKSWDEVMDWTQHEYVPPKQKGFFDSLSSTVNGMLHPYSGFSTVDYVKNLI
jgi:hypothetical protein